MNLKECHSVIFRLSQKQEENRIYYRCFDWPDSSRHCTEQRPERPGLLDLKLCNSMFYNSFIAIRKLIFIPADDIN